MKRQKKVDGSVLLLKLTNGKFAFGRIMRQDAICIYDCYSDTDDPNYYGGIQGICALKKLFHVSVYDDVITKGVFEIIGFQEVKPEELLDIPPLYTQDLLNPDDCTIYYRDGRILPASKEECRGLDYFAVWEGYSVIERIEDHFEGRVNPYLESKKLRLQ